MPSVCVAGTHALYFCARGMNNYALEFAAHPSSWTVTLAPLPAALAQCAEQMGPQHIPITRTQLPLTVHS
jgi:hypothetical protein